MVLLLLGCAMLLQGGVGATAHPLSPPQGNVTLQLDAGFSPIEIDDMDAPLYGGFGLSVRSRVDDLGQMNDVGVHGFATVGVETLRPYARATLFSVAQYDTQAALLAPGLGVRGELGLLVCPGEESFYCVSMQGSAEYDGWLGGDRPAFWLGGTLGIALTFAEEP